MGQSKCTWDGLMDVTQVRDEWTMVHGCGLCLLTHVHWVIWWIAHMRGLFEWCLDPYQMTLSCSYFFGAYKTGLNRQYGYHQVWFLSRLQIWWSHHCTTVNGLKKHCGADTGLIFSGTLGEFHCSPWSRVNCRKQKLPSLSSWISPCSFTLGTVDFC